MTTWNIYKSGEHYIGQTQALNAETAFCQYVALHLGETSPITPAEIEAKEIEPDVCEINYKGEVFILRAL